MVPKVIIVILFLLNSFSLFSQDNPLLIMTEEWAPYNYTVNGTLTGFSVEIAEEILKRLDYDTPIKQFPGARAISTLNNRPNTIFFSLFRTQDREFKYKWVGPISSGSIYFYKLRDSDITINSMEDLKSVNKISCRHAGLIHDLLIENGFKNLDTGATNSIGVYIQLLKGRCDLAISDTDLGMRYYLKSIGKDVDLLEKVPFPMFESDLYIAFSRDISDEETKKWQDTLDEMKSDGTYQQIFDKYHLND